jgi:hypothetical protein
MDKRISQLYKSEPRVNRRLPLKYMKEESQDVGPATATVNVAAIQQAKHDPRDFYCKGSSAKK